MEGTEPARRAASRLEFGRSSTDRVLFGVCGGFARRYGIDTYVVRIALLVLTLTGGLGVLLYLLGWYVSTAPDDARDESEPVLPTRSGAVAAGTAAILMAARNLDLWPGDAIMVPAVVVASGSALLWYRGRDLHPEGDPLERVLQGRRTTPIRALGGVALAIAGVVALVAGGVHVRQLPAALAAMALAGAAVLVGPYIARLTTQLRDEERARIRDQERNDMAAHLHDSVLQTLALMQRAATDPRRMVMLARRQERELRSWLYDGRGTASVATGSLSADADEMAADVELVHGLPVDLVVVGDTDMTPALDALLQAMREATVNAAKHARAELVSVYLEVEPSGVTAFVRDKGVGFEANGVGVDRRGITMSIRDRIERVGGRAVLDSAPGAGTEWELVVPR